MADMKSAATNSDLSASGGSSSTPDNFMYETKFIVLSFLNHLNQQPGRTSTVTTEQQVRKIAKEWRTRSLPSTPPRRRKKQKKSALHDKRTFSSDESLHLRAKSASVQVITKTKGDTIPHVIPNSKNKLVGRHSDPLESPAADSPDSSNTSSSLSTRISLYKRSISSASSQDGGSYQSDADDELDTSQGSTNSSLRGSRSSEYFKTSAHHLHVSRLSTVPSESEAEPDQQETSVSNEPNLVDDVLAVDIEGIEFHMSPESDDGVRDSGFMASAPHDAAKCNGRPQGDILEDFVDGVTSSDVSDLGSDEIGAKGNNDDDDEDDADNNDEDDDDADNDEEDEDVGKIGEAAGGSEHPTGSERILDKSRLFLDLSVCITPRQDEVESVMASLREEIEDEMLSLESEMDEAMRSRRESAFFPPPSVPMTPHTEVAEILARIGDDIVRNHQMYPRLQLAVGELISVSGSSLTYETFRDVARSIIDDSIPGWRQVVLLLMYSQSVTLKMAAAGTQGVSNMVDYSVKLMADLAADFIIKQGGWNAVTESSSSCLTTPEVSSHRTNPLVAAELINSSITVSTEHSTVTTAATTVISTEVTVVKTNEAEPVVTDGPDGDNSQNTQQDSAQNTNTRSQEEPGESVDSPDGTQRGGNSSSSMLTSGIVGDSSSSFVMKCTVSLALLSVGLGMALIYLKR